MSRKWHHPEKDSAPLQLRLRCIHFRKTDHAATVADARPTVDHAGRLPCTIPVGSSLSQR